MKVHRSYLKPLRALHDAGILKGAAHITGGGITDNTPRILPKGLGVRIDVGSWPVLPMFQLLRKIGNIPEQDWRRTFNLGIGMILVVSNRDLPKAAKMLKKLRERWYQIGEVVRGDGVIYAMSARMSKRLGILISGRGSNFLAIADAIAAHRLDAEIAVVISNRPEAPGIAAAQERGLHAVALASKGLDREAYDRQLIDELRKSRVDLVCLAGYMRILSGHFIREFHQRILNIHPSLLPAFPGLDAQHQALEHGVKFSGCTVHFVEEGLDSGPIISPGGGAGAGGRHGGIAFRADSEGRAPDLSGGDRPGPIRAISNRGTTRNPEVRNARLGRHYSS